MNKKRSWFARFLAIAALVAVVIALIVVASNTNLHTHSDSATTHGKQQQQTHKKPRTKAKTYTVQSGDTMVSIAHKTGLTVSELQALNPEVDPQTMIAGEVLKLQK